MIRLSLLILLLAIGAAAPVRASASPGAEPPASSASAPVLLADSLGVAPGAGEPTLADSLVRLTHALGRVDSSEARFNVDYLWVLRTALLRPSSVDSVVARAKQVGVRGLLVQVVGRGDAYYRSDILPRAEAFGRDLPPDFDPLARVVERAHAEGLEVHAWMNCMLVWSADGRPRDPRHVVNAHPEWIARLRDGRPMTRLRSRERRRLAVEGVFLNPAHPAVRTWVASIAREIASRYAVDGIHLDYIRQPDVAIGFDPTTRARFAMQSGVDPERFPLLGRERRASVDSAWTRFQRDQVTSIVCEVRDSLQSVRPGIPLSAAVIADTVKAIRSLSQSWCDWLRDGLLDRVFLMCYAPSVQTVMGQLLAFKSHFLVIDRVVPGIAVFNTSAATVVTKIKGARALGFPTLALYSYDSLFSKPSDWSQLRDRLQSSMIETQP